MSRLLDCSPPTKFISSLVQLNRRKEKGMEREMSTIISRRGKEEWKMEGDIRPKEEML